MGGLEPVRPTYHVLDVQAANGVPFRVLAIPASQQGPNKHRVPAGRGHAVAEFYDRRFTPEERYQQAPEHGQFTGAYYDVATLLGRDAYSGGRIGTQCGLHLVGDVPDWKLDREAAALVATWLESLADRRALD